MVRLYEFEMEERIKEMIEAASTLKMYAYTMYSTNPRKQEALDRMKRAVMEIIECIEILAEKPERREMAAEQGFKLWIIWAEPENVCVARIRCICGYVHDYTESSQGKVFENGESWKCPSCHRKARLYYYGWVLEEAKDEHG